MKKILNCSRCPGFCENEQVDKNDLPDYCPMMTNEDIIKKARKRYLDKDLNQFYSLTTLNEKEAYEVVRKNRIPVRPRIKELIELGKKMNIKRIGIAFCSGLWNEAKRITDILENEGFEVCSVRCKCGNIDKTELNVPREYKIQGSELFEAACNPVAQAYLLNDASTEINVIVGLCIGHDMIFTEESTAPVTTFIVKDRYTGHNPVISLYNNYHRRAFSLNKQKQGADPASTHG